MKTLLKAPANFKKLPQKLAPFGAGFRYVSRRKGFLFYAVLFIMIFIALLAVQFQQMARNEQQVAFRFEQSETARQAAEAAIDEAYQWMYQETARPDSPAGLWLIQQSGPAPLIPLAVTKAFLTETLRGDIEPEIKAEAALIDFRPTDRLGNSYVWSSGGKDGHGTLEIKVRVVFRKRGTSNQKPVASCVLTRHYDYAIVSMVSPRAGPDRRSCYSQCFPLDYVLFARTGFQQFQKFTDLANSSPIHLEVDANQATPELRGRIVFGDAPINSAAETGAAQSPYSTVSESFFNSQKNARISLDDIGAEGFRAYNYFNFWFRKSVPPERLSDIGLFDYGNGIMTLRGITHIKGSLRLDPPPNGGSWKIQGQGVLVADDFYIKSGLQKQTPDKDLCVLFTRKGNIVIDTDQPIEAALVALGDSKTRTVLSMRPLHLKGAIVVDELQFADLSGNPRWGPGNHHLDYDPMLRRNDFLYQINLSHWITFQRQTED